MRKGAPALSAAPNGAGVQSNRTRARTQDKAAQFAASHSVLSLRYLLIFPAVLVISDQERNLFGFW